MLIVSTCLLIQGTSAQAPTHLVGTWLAPTVRFAISGTGNQLKVRGFEDCLPEWCDWGEVTLTPLAPTQFSKDFNGGYATWNVGPYRRSVIFKVEPTGLSAEVLTLYDPNTGRSNNVFTTSMTKKN